MSGEEFLDASRRLRNASSSARDPKAPPPRPNYGPNEAFSSPPLRLWPLIWRLISNCHYHRGCGSALNLGVNFKPLLSPRWRLWLLILVLVWGQAPHASPPAGREARGAPGNRCKPATNTSAGLSLRAAPLENKPSKNEIKKAITAVTT